MRQRGVLLLAAAIMFGCAAGPPDETPPAPPATVAASVCTLDWDELVSRVGDWSAVTPFGRQAVEGTIYLVGLLRDPDGARLLFAVARYGRPDSWLMGGLVYCEIRTTGTGEVLEQLGVNPLKGVGS